MSIWDSVSSSPVYGLPATYDGSHLSGAALLPYLQKLSGVSVTAPTIRSQMQSAGSEGSPNGEALQLDPWTGVSGVQFGGDGGGNNWTSSDLSQYFPDAPKFDYSPYITRTPRYEQSSDGAQISGYDESLNQDAYAAAWKAHQAQVAQQYGLDPAGAGQYFVHSVAGNPTSEKGSRDSVTSLYRLNADGTAVPVDARNEHNNSWWVDQGRDIAKGLAVVGTAGAASIYGGVGAAGTGAAEGSTAASSGALGAGSEITGGTFGMGSTAGTSAGFGGGAAGGFGTATSTGLAGGIGEGVIGTTGAMTAAGVTGAGGPPTTSGGSSLMSPSTLKTIGQIAPLVAGAMGAGSAAAGGGGATGTGSEAGAAARAQDLGQQSLDFAIRQYEEGKALRDAAAARGVAISDEQLKTMQDQRRIANDYDEYNKTTFRPVEQEIVADATGYDTPGRRADAIAAANSDVQNAYAGTEGTMGRVLGRMGIAPGGGRAAAVLQDAELAKAGAVAGATTGAVRNVEAQGHARMMDAASLGRNLPSAQATAQSLGITAGNASAGNAAGAVTTSNAGVPLVQNGYQQAIGSNVSAGGLYGQVNGQAMTQAAARDAQLATLGRAAGTYLGSDAGSTAVSGWLNGLGDYFSDERMKTGTGKKLDTKKALAGINKTPVKAGWKYRAGSPAADGGRAHDGAMAGDMARNMGPEVAPGGRVVDGASVNAHLMAGVQELSKRMGKIERKVA